MTNEYVRRTQELRRSSAASPVDRDLTRRMANDDAIAEQLDDWHDGQWGFGHSREACNCRCPVEFGNTCNSECH